MNIGGSEERGIVAVPDKQEESNYGTEVIKKQQIKADDSQICNKTIEEGMDSSSPLPQGTKLNVSAGFVDQDITNDSIVPSNHRPSRSNGRSVPPGVQIESKPPKIPNY